MHYRLTRPVVAAALLGAPLTLAGAGLFASSVPASADTAGTNVCSSLVTTTDLTTDLTTTTISGCHEHGSGTVEGFIDPNNPNGPQSGTLHWATGNATSDFVGTSVFDSTVPCPAGEIGSDTYSTVVSGAYAGSTGSVRACSDFSGYPIIVTTSVGPVVI